jgi:hypothetical protein
LFDNGVAANFVIEISIDTKTNNNDKHMETKNLFETFTNAQKQAVENMNSATENMKSMFSENVNSDFFKKWYDSQMSFFNNNGEKQNEQSYGVLQCMDEQPVGSC